jgi:hypothetical protein
MEEINLELEKDNHKTVNFSNASPSTGGVNIVKDKSSDIGLDLLINQSKVGGDNSKLIDEFKPSDPIVPNNISSNISSISTTGIEKEIDLGDIGIIDKPSSPFSNNKPSSPFSNNKPSSPFSNNKPSNQNNSSTIDLSSNNDLKELDLDLNLDNLLSDNNSSSLSNNNNSNIHNSNSLNLDTSSRPSTPQTMPQQPKKSYEEIQKEKAEYIRKLERLEKRGFNIHKKYTMESDFNEVKNEFDRLARQRECDQSVKFQRKMLVAFITAIEFLNNKFDPVDLKLEGWSESIHENLNDYDDVFEELHEKYKGKSQMAPELKLLLMVGGSGFMFHLTNTMFKSSLPGMGDVMRQNPDLMKQFASAAASTMGSMGGEGGGFGNLMGDILGGSGSNSGGSSGGSRSRAPPQQPRREMNGPPDISDILNNMSNNQNVNVDLNSGFSESEVETSSGIKKTRTLDLNI